MAPKALFIVGLQKSGTTPLNRSLQVFPEVRHPFRSEGNDFWGNEPPFSPAGFPAGSFYQQAGGERGHCLDAADATAEAREVMRQRFAALGDAPLLLNKNPYNACRVGWLRAIFPEACIVACVREPVANCYSLLKKFVPHKGRGLPPEDGWWGVKPAGWRSLRDQDKLTQCARQWRAVNERLLESLAEVDHLVFYDDFCRAPARSCQRIVEGCLGAGVAAPPLPPLRSCDDEHQRGSRLRSKNRYFSESGGSLALPEEEEAEFPPLSAEEVEAVRAATGRIWEELRGRPGALPGAGTA
ncbi:MAG: sulfotransferase [Planctomycetes bacterium]|nr:sulfotransferase [Planctomycetota bacterium]